MGITKRLMETFDHDTADAHVKRLFRTRKPLSSGARELLLMAKRDVKKGRNNDDIVNLARNL